jgi:hypothetical protein
MQGAIFSWPQYSRNGSGDGGGGGVCGDGGDNEMMMTTQFFNFIRVKC